MKLRAAHLLTRACLPILTRLDPETAHGIGLKGLRYLERYLPTLEVSAGLAVEMCGLRFAHPLGLAAGFDKNGDYLDALGAIGFSHIELGTVTPRAQPGNTKPRMFRFAKQCALVNRMGFNNLGVDHLVERLQSSRFPGVRGVSIGKNFDTPIDQAHHDYVICLQKVYRHADYIAVNISSPNTVRLRELQETDGLQRILGALLEARAGLEIRHGKRVPLWVKVAPDLNSDQVAALARQLRSLQIDGVIATNTSIDLSLLQGPVGGEVQGGVSGAPLHERSVRIVAQLRAELGPEFPIIGVGGIFNAASAFATLAAGANLLQIYTAFAYRGGLLVDDILRALAARAASTRRPGP